MTDRFHLTLALRSLVNQMTDHELKELVEFAQELVTAPSFDETRCTVSRDVVYQEVNGRRNMIRRMSAISQWLPIHHVRLLFHMARDIARVERNRGK